MDVRRSALVSLVEAIHEVDGADVTTSLEKKAKGTGKCFLESETEIPQDDVCPRYGVQNKHVEEFDIETVGSIDLTSQTKGGDIFNGCGKSFPRGNME